MVRNVDLSVESLAVQAHLSLVQGTIQRMAENSRSCKVWCVTLVAATLVLVARTGEPHHALLALLPTLLFLLLDTYYLALERGFRKSYDTFVGNLHGGHLALRDIYIVRPTGMGWTLTARSFGSLSISLFYLPLVVTVLLAWLLILAPGSLSG